MRLGRGSWAEIYFVDKFLVGGITKLMDIIKSIIDGQRDFFNSECSKNIKFRIEKLKLLYKTVKENQDKITAALKIDLNKGPFEAYEAEIGLVLSEIRFTLKHLKKWAKPCGVKTPLMHFPSKSYVYREPFGVVLIMSPWNYPFLLALSPLIGAMAAGNCCIIKPSRYASATSSLLVELIGKTFPSNYVAVVEGGREANQELLAQKFDYIFFTGSPAVGHVVMEAASKNLTPVTLELGGKSPCIVDCSANIKLAAKRIVWGKFFNGGQTCVAPDYILVQNDAKAELIDCLKFYIKKFYGERPLESEDLPKIINEKHFDRLLGLLNGQNVVFGGNYNKDSLKIEPSIIDSPAWDSPVMSEEIFGPLLPVICFENYDDLIDLLKSKEKSLALYLFTTDKTAEKRIYSSLSFGGGCINDTVIHLANENLPFGGVGASGMGQYHGKYSFETFSHVKSKIKKSNLIDINLRYPPFGKGISLLKKILH